MKTKILISKQQINTRLHQLAQMIKMDYGNEHIILIGVLDGSFIFLADLLRMLWKEGVTNCEVEFIGISSYTGTESTRTPILTKNLKSDIKGRHVIIVEDIVDTGHTLHMLQNLLDKQQPLSLKTLVLLSKPSRREIEVQVNYIGFEIENKWVIGYGFDTDGFGRGMNEIHEKID